MVIMRILFLVLVSYCFAETIFGQGTGNYEPIEVHGWKVFASKEFLASEVHTKVRKILEEKLSEISSNIDSAVLATLRSIPIWVDLDIKNDFLHPIDYHPSEQWLSEHGLNPRWAGSVEIGNTSIFLEQIGKHPGYLARVFADGYDHRKFSYQIPGIEQLYKKLKESIRFVDLMEREGIRGSQPADQRNLFCILSTIYLSRADRFPFARDDLKGFNADAFAFMKEIWGP